MSARVIFIFAILLAVALLLAGCNSQPPPSPPIGIAFVAPMQLNLRKELAPKSPVVGAVKHGEKLDVLATRRRFIKVRAPQGIEGWADAGQLLSQAQMDGLRRLAEQCKSLPSQGEATVYDELNVHTEPVRTSPSFEKIVEGVKVDVVGHRLAPKSTTRTVPVFEQPAEKKPPKKVKESNRLPPPPMPQPPKLPENWLELSQIDEDDLAEMAAKKEAAAKPEGPVVIDDWNLIRTKDGKAGWVLARMLVMAIPDDIAQYAEGHRIAAYRPLGEVKDNGESHLNYLWATVRKGPRDSQFDSFRVFVWSVKHHRYETAYVERNVKGYYPIDIIKAGDAPAFTVVVEDKDGSLVRKTYAFNGFRVRMINKEPYQPVKLETQLASARPAPAPAEDPQQHGWAAKLRQWRERVFGH